MEPINVDVDDDIDTNNVWEKSRDIYVCIITENWRESDTDDDELAQNLCLLILLKIIFNF